jgi:hypothetical protein
MQSGSDNEGTELKYESGTGHSYLKSIYSLGNMYFQTAGANNRMTITNTGYVGIGTASPYSILDIQATGVGWGEGISVRPSSGGYSQINFRHESYAGGSTNSVFVGRNQSGANDVFTIMCQGMSGSALHRADSLLDIAPYTGVVAVNKLGIGTTAPATPLHVVGGNSTGYGLLVEQAISCRHVNGKNWNTNGIDDGDLYLNYNKNLHTRLNWTDIASTGRVYANTSVLTGQPMVINGGQLGHTSSRAAIKDDIRDVTGGIDTLKALRPVRFRFKPEAIGDGTNDMVAFDERIGFVAEEMASVSHELATWEWLNDDGGVWLDNTANGGDERPSLEEAVPIGWETDAVVSITVAALKELIARVEALESA